MNYSNPSGIEKTKFYYVRDNLNRPVMTVCLVHLDGVNYRGIALCSDKDHPVKKTGRNIAWGRANKAIAHSTQSTITGIAVEHEPIQRTDALLKIRELMSRNQECCFPFVKSESCPVLTAFERNILYGPDNL